MIFEVLMNYIYSEDLKNEGRMSITSFIRERVLTFPKLVLFFINQSRKTLQVSLNEFCESANLIKITKQAFSKARKKLSAHAFKLLNLKLVEEYYTDNTYSLWKGFRLIAIDGSDIQLPNNNKLKNTFGTAKNKTGPTIGMAKISYAYDVLNRIILDAEIDRCKTSERDLSVKHVEAIRKLEHSKLKNIYLFDRGYPSLGMLFYLNSKGENFLFRCSISSCFAKVKEVFDQGEKDIIVRLYANQTNGDHVKELKRRVPELDRGTAYIDIRVVIVVLDTGEEELLITSLLDPMYLREEFKGLYNYRWCAEENYKWHKSGFELENFSGNTGLAIEQELYSLMLTANMATLLIQEAQEEVDNDPKIQSRKHPYKINKRLAIAVMHDRLLEGILNPQKNMEELCNELKAEIKRYLCEVRPGRKFKRQEKNRQKYGITTRRCL